MDDLKVKDGYMDQVDKEVLNIKRCHSSNGYDISYGNVHCVKKVLDLDSQAEGDGNQVVGDRKSQAEGDGKSPAVGDGKSQVEGDEKAPVACDGKAEAEGDRKSQAEGDGKSPAVGDGKYQAGLMERLGQRVIEIPRQKVMERPRWRVTSR